MSRIHFTRMSSCYQENERPSFFYILFFCQNYCKSMHAIEDPVFCPHAKNHKKFDLNLNYFQQTKNSVACLTPYSIFFQKNCTKIDHKHLFFGVSCFSLNPVVAVRSLFNSKSLQIFLNPSSKLVCAVPQGRI